MVEKSEEDNAQKQIQSSDYDRPKQFFEWTISEYRAENKVNKCVSDL